MIDFSEWGVVFRGKGYPDYAFLADLVEGFRAVGRRPIHLVGKDAQRDMMRYLRRIQYEFWPETILALCAVTISLVVAGAGPRCWSGAPAS